MEKLMIYYNCRFVILESKMINYFLLQGMAVVAARATRLPIYSSLQ
jgi:hypothetical protein